jgi:hypothetical protein
MAASSGCVFNERSVIMFLYEELFLLALNDQKGQINNSIRAQLQYGLSGGMLSDLVLAGKIGLDQNNHLIVLNADSCNNDLLDEALQLISASPKARKANFWVQKVAANLKKLSNRVGEQLVHQGVLTREDKRYLWVMPHSEYPNPDANAKYWVKQWLREAVLTGAHLKKNPHAIALLGLVRASDMLEFVFTKDELRSVNKQIDLMVISDEIGNSVKEAIDAIEAAAVRAIKAD